MHTGSYSFAVGHDKVDLTIDDRGQGRTFLLLHGGAGLGSVASFAQSLADTRQARVISPTHPGFGGTTRPDWLADMTGLAEVYTRLAEELDLTDVTVIGNSIGGWIAAEMALLASDRISGVVLVDAVGIAVEDHPVADVFSLSPDELSRLSYHDPTRFRIDPSALSQTQRAEMAANFATLGVYGGGPSMMDPTLSARLAGITLPTLVVWGEDDQIVDAAYGRAYAAAIPDARFRILPGAGHLPQIETPDQLVTTVWDFAEGQAGH